VGATLFTLLTGQAVHGRDGATPPLGDAASRRAPSVSSVAANVPASLAAVIDRALADPKSGRWANAVEMRDAILAVKTEMFGVRPSRIALVDLLAQEPVASAEPPPPPSAVSRSGPETRGTKAALNRGSARSAEAPPRRRPGGVVFGLGACLVVAVGLGVSAFAVRSSRAPDVTRAATPLPSAATVAVSSASTAATSVPTVAASAPAPPPPPLEPKPGRCAAGNLEGCIAECAQKDLASCALLATMYRTGRGGAKDESKAFALYKAGCDADQLASCDGLGVMYQNGTGGVGRDYGLALRLFKKGCDGGLGVACADLGQAYMRGKGTPKDDARAVALYKRACELPAGAIGCSLLGILQARGRTVQQDTTRGLALLRKGCEAGDPLGCASLGELYAEGKILPKDEARAVTLFKQGCPTEDEPGCFALGLAYEKGLDVPVDRAKAIELYKRGCQQDDSWDCAQAKRLKGR
jgi:TPR repeat protein